MSLKTTLTAAFAATAFALPAVAQDIVITDSYARSASPAAKSGAAFLVIENRSDTDERLTGAASQAAKRVELHTHEKGSQGIMKMRHVPEGFPLPAGGTLKMRRGGDHVMFMGLTAPFEQGDMIPLTLTFENAGEIETEVPVDLERQPREGHGNAHGHGMTD
ncbi:copper chaperone PCu(A)C [Roseovarius sp. SYSU LYC5161]|uniref:copper chaperone PCu(A)C n=1 Tax=Roseovarius halophilus (ex Wu et al. 2025) TaxID=3376060 RepID=UPI002871DFE1|nr:copper chaperone PCu(A)C [Roseovarius sp.]